jgi:hypothetical protein
MSENLKLNVVMTVYCVMADSHDIVENALNMYSCLRIGQGPNLRLRVDIGLLFASLLLLQCILFYVS